MEKTNWFAIVACAAAGMALGFLWYGVLFKSQWMAGNGITADEAGKMMKNGVEMSTSQLPMIINTVSLFVYALLMNWLVNKTNSFNLQAGATVGAVVGLIPLFGIYTGNRFAGNPTSLSMVDGFYVMILFVVMGAILGAWRKK